MELSDLKIFKAVVDEGGITKAADKLLRVQSSVTTRIKQLEQNLGVELFIREGKRLHVSPAGRVLLDYATRLENLAEEARSAVHEQSPCGRFRLGSMESSAAVRLPAPLTEYYRLYPKVDLQLTTGKSSPLARQVLSGDLDAALVAEPIATEPFDYEPVFVEEMVLVTRIDHPPIGPDSAVPSTIIAFGHGCSYHRRLETWCESRGTMPTRTMDLASYHAILGCVAAGMGMALLPRLVLEAFPGRNQIRVHEMPAGQDKAETLLIWRKGTGSLKIEALLNVLKAGSSSETAPKRLVVGA